MKRNLGKKNVAILASAALIMGAISVNALAAGNAENITATLSPQVGVTLNGTEQMFFTAQGLESHPIIFNGTTYLPLRATGELMGKNVNWDQSTLTVSLSGTRTGANKTTGKADTTTVAKDIPAQIRPDFIVNVDGKVQSFKDANGNVVYPLLYEGSTYLPIRSIAGLLGCDVAWDSVTQTVALKETGSLVTDADSFNKGTTQPTTPAQPTQPTTPVKPTTPQTRPTQPTTQATGNYIGVEAAKEKALAHAGITATDVTFVKEAYLDREDGRWIYEIEFYGKDYTEYDYEIDAITGAVLSYDYDAENYKYTRPATTPTTTGTDIGVEKAKSIALAEVRGAAANNVVKVDLDRDDGRLEYEITIIYNEMEYEFEIDAATGRIMSKDVESIYD